MPQSNIPTDKRRPGVAISFETSGAFSLVGFTRAIALVGTKSSAGTGTAATPGQVFSADDCDRIGGVGSPLALMGRKVLEVFRLLGGAAQIWLVPVADPAGTAAIHRFTVTGTATEAGDLVLKIAGRTIRVPVASGD